MLNSRSLARFVLPALALIALSGKAGADPVLDQVHESFNTGFNAASPSLIWQQGVTSGASGLLNSVDILFSATGTVDFFVNLGAPWQDDANDYSALALPVLAGWNNIDVSSANISLSPGTLFAIGLSGNNTAGLSFTGFTGLPGSGGSSYAGGALYLDGSAHTSGLSDMNFRTWVDVSPVPVPAAVWLFGTALVGLFAFARRRSWLPAWFALPVNGR